MKKTILPVILLLSLLAPLPSSAAQGDLARGAYIAKLGDCTACHTVPGKKAFSGGLPMNSPIGIIYSTNITPDPKHGIGDYTLQDFTRALREGVAKDGHYLYPAMPSAEFSMMSPQDIADLYAYMMNGVKPVDYAPPETKLHFPMNQRWGLFFWNKLFSIKKDFKEEPGHDAEWNRGAYLVKSLGHCGACHTPRNIFYGEESYDENSADFLGGDTIDNWQAPDLRGNPASGLGHWREEDIVSFLKSGHGHGAAAYGAMTQVVEDSTQYMSGGDLKSIAHYLKSFEKEDERAAYQAGKQNLAKDGSYPMERPGAGLYASHCAGCHMADGKGAAPDYPGLAGNPVVLAKDPISLIHIVLEGGTAAHTETGPAPKTMPRFPQLTDTEIAEVVSYIRSSWGNKAAAVSTHQVTALRKTLAADNKAKKDAADQAAGN